jgi:DNA primase
VRPPTTEQRLSFAQAASQYQRDLAVHIDAQAYLKSRGFTEQVAQQFQLGVVTSPLVGHERYRGRLAIPYLTPAGPVNFRFRCLEQHKCSDAVLFVDRKTGKPIHCQKYLGLEGLETNLYNVGDLKKTGDAVAVCEGELDAITLSMSGIPAVAVPGASSWKKHYRLCLEDFTRVYAFGDADDAGKSLNKKLIESVRAVPVRLPKGEDCNSLYLTGGADALKRLISG